MVKDSVSNLIVSLKNASAVKKDVIEVPYTRMSMDILSVLEKEGYITEVDKTGKEDRKHINVTMKYDNGTPAITDVKRVSKFSRRVYMGAKDIKLVKNGYGLVVLSTPNGVVSGAAARKANAGGEVLFEIW